MTEILENDVWMVWPNFTCLDSFIHKHPFLNLLLLLQVNWLFKRFNDLNLLLILIKNYDILNKNDSIFIMNNILIKNNNILNVFGAFVIFLSFLNILLHDHFFRRHLSQSLQIFDFWNFNRRLLR